MTADFRALCAELAAELDHNRRCLLDDASLTHPLADRARAALAEQEADGPAVPEGREPASVTEQPSDEEIMGLMPQQMHEDLACAARAMANEAGTDNRKAKGFMRIALNRHAVDLARAVLARWGRPAPAPPADGEVVEVVERLRTVVAAYKSCRNTDHIWSLSGNGVNARLTVTLLTRAAELLQRQAPQPPADGEVAELAAEIRHFLAGYQQMRGLDPEHIYSIHRGDKMEAHITVSRLTRAAELLQRQVLVPVSVSERLPGPEDCAPWPQPSDKSGWCWMSRTVHGFYGSFAIWEQVSVVPMCREVYTHWLPAHALPLPEVGA